ncbi:MAG TPA: PQQ-binding-like beta-propeller repeat protein [Streptosporangiaceae bacterium]|nr:PQQ-binding-like beta-propeller repeat protein [Streptosporangiaceae bacterium]
MRNVVIGGVRGTAWAAAACVVAACTGGGGAASSAPSATAPASSAPARSSPARTATGPAAAWPEYGQNAGRSGVAAGLAAAGPLSQRWTARLDGAVYGQPLVVGATVIAATENDTVYALNESTGTVTWRTHLGSPVPLSSLPCGDIDPLGITGTPVYDESNGLVYAVAETTGYHHVMFGLAVINGAIRVQREIPVPGDPAAFQQRPGLAIGSGRVYAAFGGLFGDCGQYIGMVVGVPLSGTGTLVSWHTPTSREGAVWGIAGPVTGPSGDLWVSTGNGAAGQGQPYDGSDSVNRLSPNLARMNFFAPATWAQDNASDLDLGSTQPVLAAGDSTFIMGKRGVGYLLTTSSMGGIGGQLAARSICPAFGAGAVSGSTVYEPCYGGLAAISVSAAQRTISVLWRGPGDGNGSPSIGGGAVWVASTSSGTLYELSPANGAVRSRIGIGGGLTHFPSVSLAGGTAFIGTLDGVVAVNGA